MYTVFINLLFLLIAFGYLTLRRALQHSVVLHHAINVLEEAKQVADKHNQMKSDFLAFSNTYIYMTHIVSYRV